MNRAVCMCMCIYMVHHSLHHHSLHHQINLSNDLKILYVYEANGMGSNLYFIIMTGRRILTILIYKIDLLTGKICIKAFIKSFPCQFQFKWFLLWTYLVRLFNCKSYFQIHIRKYALMWISSLEGISVRFFQKIWSWNILEKLRKSRALAQMEN